MGPWANFGTVDGGDESDDDGDLVSEEDIASGIDLLSTSQMLVEDDDLGDILRHIAAGKRALTCSRSSPLRTGVRRNAGRVRAPDERRGVRGAPRPKRAPRKLCANWGLMYCGNVVRVERDLRAIGRQIDAPVAVERFDWPDPSLSFACASTPENTTGNELTDGDTTTRRADYAAKSAAPPLSNSRFRAAKCFSAQHPLNLTTSFLYSTQISSDTVARGACS